MTLEYDDLFIFEGKAIGTADLLDITPVAQTLVIPDADPVEFARMRKAGRTIGKKKLAEMQEETKTKLLKLIHNWQDDKIPEAALRKGAAKTMKTAWKNVFMAGLRAGGTRGKGVGKGKTVVRLAPRDEQWLRGAMAHEMGFLNKFMSAITEGTWKMPLERRAQMYVNALESFYNSARVIALPANVIVDWRGPNDKITCPSCQYMFEHTPFVKYNLPTTPRAGMTICLCLTDRNVDILTRRGTIPWCEVRVGDEVFTHRSRWRKVLQKTINRVQSEHGFAVIVGENGRLFGVTDDHCVWTECGWIEARQAAEWGVPVLSLREPNYQAKSEWALSRLLDAQTMGRTEGGSAAANLEGCTRIAADTVRGLGFRLVQYDQKGRPEICSILGWRYDPVHLSLPMGVATGEWPYSGRMCFAPQEPGLYGRPFGEFAASRTSQTRDLTWRGSASQSNACPVSILRSGSEDESFKAQGRSREVLLARLCERREVTSCGPDLLSLQETVSSKSFRRCQTPKRQCFLLSDLLRKLPDVSLCDPCVQLLQQELQTSSQRRQTVEVGQVLLLSAVLPEGTPLYDLTVADDNSFVAAGMVVHNTNCRDHLVIRRAGPEKVKLVEGASKYTRGGHVKNLRKIKRLGHL